LKVVRSLEVPTRSSEILIRPAGNGLHQRTGAGKIAVLDLRTGKCNSPSNSLLGRWPSPGFPRRRKVDRNSIERNAGPQQFSNTLLFLAEILPGNIIFGHFVVSTSPSSASLASSTPLTNSASNAFPSSSKEKAAGKKLLPGKAGEKEGSAEKKSFEKKTARRPKTSPGKSEDIGVWCSAKGLDVGQR